MKTYRRIATTFFILFLLIGLSACVEVKQEVTLNPDGSGKILIDAIIQADNPKDSSAENKLKETITKILRETKGVESWKDVQYKWLTNSSITLKGTAYFRDINAVEIPTLGTEFLAKKNGNSLIIEKKEKENEPLPGQKKEPEKLTEAQITQKVQETKDQWQSTKPMMAMMLTNLKKETTFLLPGKITQFNNFQKLSDNSVHLKIEGTKLLEAMDALMSDDEWLRKDIISAQPKASDGPPMDEELLAEKVFGNKGPVQVNIQLDKKALFDYKAEVAAAKPSYVKTLENLGLSQSVSKAIGSDLLLFSVGRIDDTRRTGTMSGDLNFELMMSGDLLARTGEPYRVRLEKAIDDKGTNLVKESEHQFSGGYSASNRERQTNFTQRLKLANPPRDATKILELSGSVEVRDAYRDPKAKTVIKGFMKQLGKPLSAASLKGKKMGITAMNKTQFDAKNKAAKEAEGEGSGGFFDQFNEIGENDLAFIIQDPNGGFLALEVLDSKGEALPGRVKSTVRNNTELTLIYTFNELPPQQAQVAVYVETPKTLVKIPYQLTNVPLP